jgi:hypothetical protein
VEQLELDFTNPTTDHVKRCSKCGEVKVVSEFNKCKKSRDGLQYCCRECGTHYNKHYRQKPENQVRPRECKRKYKQSPKYNRERAREYNREYNRQYSRKHAKTPKRREYNRDYRRKRRLSDPQFMLDQRLRARLQRVLEGNPKAAPTLELIGCSKQHLLQHIQSQFSEGMHWNSGIDIDHIIPMSAFDLANPEEQRAAMSWLNLRPMCASENRSKSDKIDFALVSKRWFMLFPTIFNRLAERHSQPARATELTDTPEISPS